MLTATVHVFSASVFCTGPGIGSNRCYQNCEKAETVVKGDNCKNRNDIAGQSIDIEWHMCLGDTSVQLLHKLQ